MPRAKALSRGAAAFVVTALLTLLLSSCPLPFEFSPRGTVGGGGGSDDPANPAVTAAPTFVVVSKITGEVLTTIDTDALVLLESETRDAVIYYKIIDPSELAHPPMPQPGHPDTKVYNPSQPPEVAGHLSSFAFVAMAIGPNMYPSVLVGAEIEVLYSMTATPVFSPTPGTSSDPEVYATDLMVSIASPDAGAEIWYTWVTGAGPAQDPIPELVGELYEEPIPIAGDGQVVSFSAVAVVDQKENSFVAQASYGISYPGISIDDGGDGYINIEENSGEGVDVTVSGVAAPDMTYSVGGLANCTVNSTSGAYDGDLTLKLIATADETVSLTVTLTDLDGNTIDLSDSSVADLMAPALPALEAYSLGPGPRRDNGDIPTGARIFGTDVQFAAPSGGGANEWRYQYDRWGSGWTGWTYLSGPFNCIIPSGVPDGGLDVLGIRVEERDASGNWSPTALHSTVVGHELVV